MSHSPLWQGSRMGYETFGFERFMQRRNSTNSAGSHLHFITASTYRRVRLFDSPRFRKRFIETLDQLRTEFDFRLVGYVLMPEHFHLLISPSKAHSPSRIVGSLKQRTARHIIENLKRCKEPWCRRMLETDRIA